MPHPPVSTDWKRIVRRFRRPVVTAAGTFATRESLVLRVRLPDGRAGYAEHAPWPGFPVASITATEAALRKACAEGRPETLPLVRAALAWTDAPSSAPPLPCAALLRDDTEAPARLAAGFRTLKRKIGVAPLRDEQRAVAALVRAAGPDVALRLDANGSLAERDTERWCDFLSEFPEIEWLEQPMPPGAEDAMRRLAERAGVAERIALDESVCDLDAIPADWPGVLAVKPVLLADLSRARETLRTYPRVAYASAFETPFGREAALRFAAGDPRAPSRALGFDTVGAFDDDLDLHPAGPLATSAPFDADALWARLG